MSPAERANQIWTELNKIHDIMGFAMDTPAILDQKAAKAILVRHIAEAEVRAAAEAKTDLLNLARSFKGAW